MARKTILSGAGFYIMQSTLSLTENSLKALGVVTSFLGGALYAMSYIFSGNINASYYGSGSVNGSVALGLNLPEYEQGANQSLRVQKTLVKQTGQFDYDLANYFDEEQIRAMSYYLALAGMTLKVLGDFIGTVRQGHADYCAINTSMPSVCEYVEGATHTLIDSATLFVAGCITMSCMCRYVDVNSLNFSMSFPQSDNSSFHVADYDGPVVTKTMPLDWDTAYNKTFSLSVFSNVIDILIKEMLKLNSIVNVTYGSRASLFIHEKRVLPLDLPIIAGVSLSMCGLFFTNKRQSQRNKRMIEAEVGNKAEQIEVNHESIVIAH